MIFISLQTNSLGTTHKTTESAIQIHCNYQNGIRLGGFYLAKEFNNHIYNLKNIYNTNDN